jgi:hypothetical protein
LFTQTTCDVEGQPVRDPQSTTYLASSVPAESFGGLVRRAALARGLAHAQQAIFLGDEAAWVWEIARTGFPQAAQILDYYHASEHVGDLARAIYEDAGGAQNWALRWRSLLYEGELDVLLAEARVAAGPTVNEALQRELEYLERNRARMVTGVTGSRAGSSARAWWDVLAEGRCDRSGQLALCLALCWRLGPPVEQAARRRRLTHRTFLQRTRYTGTQQRANCALLFETADCKLASMVRGVA